MSKTVDTEKTAYYLAAVDRMTRRLLDRLEREGAEAVTANDVYQVAKSVISDIKSGIVAVIAFPVAIGDVVKCACEDTDEYGNPVTELAPYEVKGVACYEGRYYVLDECREMYEVGTRYCIIPEREEPKAVRNA